MYFVADEHIKYYRLESNAAGTLTLMSASFEANQPFCLQFNYDVAPGTDVPLSISLLSSDGSLQDNVAEYILRNENTFRKSLLTFKFVFDRYNVFIQS